ncbi:MAG TPA: DUF4236 domain-containing protein [Abditibacteriaceae bacterium]|jgi:hypothetical protein
MGWRFQKTLKVAPGVRLNIGLKSIGVSIGRKGARISSNTRTGTHATIGLFGTGLSYTKKIGGLLGALRRKNK